MNNLNSPMVSLNLLRISDETKGVHLSVLSIQKTHACDCSFRSGDSRKQERMNRILLDGRIPERGRLIDTVG